MRNVNNSLIKSPLRYPGGKSKVVKIISKLIPEFYEFREPLVGGGSLFIYLKQKYPNRKFWINDKNFSVFNFWKMCKKDLKEVVNQVLKWKGKYLKGDKLYNFLTRNYKYFNNIKKASAFFILNRITFSGVGESGGYSEQAFKYRFTISSVERLKKLEKILKRTKITNYDCRKVIEAKGNNVFVFLDPPYFSAARSPLYGKNGNLNKNFDHIQFAEEIKKCDYKWLITYDDSKYIHNIFSFAKKIKKWNLNYAMRNATSGSSQNGKELFISNYLK